MMKFCEWLILTEITREEALDIFGLTSIVGDEQLKKLYKKLALKLHPDRNIGKDTTKQFQKLQAAYELLAKQPQYQKEPRQYQNHRRDVPEWQPDKRSSNNDIRQQNYRDLNYFKKHIWELAKENGSVKEITIWSFDGSFSRGVITVYGNEYVYDEMGKAMYIWEGGNTKAVLVTDQQHPYIAKIIWMHGKPLENPIELNHDSFNANPFNDDNFQREMRKIVNDSTPF